MDRPRLAQLLALEGRQDLEQAELFAAWRLFFERLAERDPVVLVFEDMQWADAPLLEFVAYLLEWSRNHAIFVLALARPEVADRIRSGRAGAGTARRSRSTSVGEAMEALLDGVVPGLPADLRSRSSRGPKAFRSTPSRRSGCCSRAACSSRRAGVPAGGGDRGARGAGDPARAARRRLDGLTAEERRRPGRVRARQDLQQGGARGRVWLGRRRLDILLAGLVRKEVLRSRSDPRSPERGQYGFLQDLLRQVAYETLSRRERKADTSQRRLTSSSSGGTARRTSSRSSLPTILFALELDTERGRCR